MCTYKFYTDKENRKVVLCLMKYRDKTIKGKAVCHADDTYDEEVGKTLAKLRCDSELWRHKVKNKYIHKEGKRRDALQATADYANAEEAFTKICTKYVESQENLASYIDKLKGVSK